MFNGSITNQFEKDRGHLKVIMSDFTYNFEKYFFKEGIARCFFNNVTIRGYRICPVDPKTYLYVQKCINSLCTEFPICNVAVFYEEYLLYSDLPQGQVEVLHKYLFLSQYTRREGFEPNWVDSCQKGEIFKVNSKGVNSGEMSEDEKEMETLAEELGFENVEYDDLLKRTFSTFCKLNPDGFKGSRLNKKGFLIGPTIVDHKDEDDIPKTYEIFSPKVYIKVDP